MVEKILSLNSFGCPRTSRDFYKNNVFSGKATHSTRERPLFTCVGIWLLAARINHSCVGNCRHSFIGDVQIVRAARDIPAVTKLHSPYRPSTAFESYYKAQKHLETYQEFECACELCKGRSTTTEAVRNQRRELFEEFMKKVPEGEPFDFVKATQLPKGEKVSM